MRRPLILACILLSVVSVCIGQVQRTTAILEIPNTFQSTNEFNIGIWVGPVLYSNRPVSPANGTFIYFQDGVLGSNPCTGGGTGAFGQFINGAWNCSTASGATPLPIVSVATYGATGNGSTDDTTAIQTAINACPQTTPTIGCDMWFPAGIYKITTALSVGLLKGIHLNGVGACGTGGCAVEILTSGAIYGIIVGNGTSPNTSGFQITNIGFKDSTGNGLGGIDFLATRDASVTNVTCLTYLVGACIELDGGTNFTQFISMTNVNTWQSKFRFQTAHKTASNFIWGGEGNCQNSGLTDVISGSIDTDLGFTNQTAGVGEASEYTVDTQAQNCQTGIALFNSGGNRFSGKAIEDTINARPSLSFGVIVDGDTASLANGNFFDGEQITKAGTGFYLKPFATNTTIIAPIFNGTNGVDLVADSVALGTTRLVTNKRLTGWNTNLSAINRVTGTSTVTATTAANSDNGDLSIVPGAFINVTNVLGGTTSFNGQFPVLTVSTNDSTNITTLTWLQAGASENGTIVSGITCGPTQSCIGGQSTMLTSGVGALEITGDQFTQDIAMQQPAVPSGQTLPLSSLSNGNRIYWDGTRTDIIEANNGVVHLVDGGTTIFNGNNSAFYTPQPTIVTGGNGTVNCAGTGPSTCTWQSGSYFGLSWTGSITINNIVQTISSVTDITHIVVTGSTGTLTGVNFNASGIPGVPPCSSPLGGVCQSSDDKKRILLNNTNGSTVCLPPIGAGYPAGYGFSVEFEPGSVVAQFASITPPGSTSYYSISCAGTAAQFRGSSSAVNLSYNQGVFIYNNGVNWFAVSGADTTPIDQIVNGILNTNNVNLAAGSWNGGGSAATSGANFFIIGGASNSSGSHGGDVGIISGSDSASGANGSARVIQTFNAGTGLGSKTGYIARACADVTGTDCLTVPASDTGSVRLTVSGTDWDGGIGILYTGSGQGTPVQVQVAGVYNNVVGGAIVESSCIAGQYYEIGSSGLDNGAGDCSPFDSPRRVGIALTATTGTCNQSTPCHVPIVIIPASGGQLYSTVQTPITTVGLTTAITNNTGSLQMYHVNGIISCRATANGDTMNLNVQWTDGSSTLQNLNGAALCTTLGSASWAAVGGDVLVANGQTIKWQTNTVTNTHTSTWDLRLSVNAIR